MTQSLNQIIFNRAWLGLKSQGFEQSRHPVSVDEYEGCAYRGADGLRCAAGHLLDDHLYQPSFEGKLVNDPDILRAIALTIDIHDEPLDRDLLGDLQNAHDTGFRPEEMEFELRAVAERWELELPDA